MIDECSCTRNFGSPLHTLVRNGLVVQTDVLQNRPTEAGRILRHRTDVHAQLVLRYRADVHAVEQDCTGLNVIKTRHQAHQRGFAGTSRTDHRNRLTCRYGKRYPFEDRLIRVVAKDDVVEDDFAAYRARQRNGLFRVTDPLGCVEHPKDALRRRHRTLERVVALCQLPNRPECLFVVEGKGNQ